MTSQYKKSVVVALLLTALIISADRTMRGSFPRPRVFVALLFIWLVLGFMAEFAPKLAAYFAWLVTVGVIISNGPYVFEGIRKRITAPLPTAKGK